MTIKGANLGHALAVTFNGTVATVISDKNSTIKVDVPAGATTGYIGSHAESGGRALSLFALHGRRGLVVPRPPLQPTRASLTGSGNSDSGVVSGNATRGSPTGTMTFFECGPTAEPEPCTSQDYQVGSPVTLVPGAHERLHRHLGPIHPELQPATGAFAGYYSGDGNYLGSGDASTDECFDVVFTPLGDAYEHRERRHRRLSARSFAVGRSQVLGVQPGR